MSPLKMVHLLSQGQLGNIGLLPQIFKDHFKSDSADARPRQEPATPTKNGVEYGNVRWLLPVCCIDCLAEI